MSNGGFFVQRLIDFFSFIDRTFARIVEMLLVFIVLSMVGFVVLQVVLRNFFDSGIPWADVASRHMVLWIAFLGAMLATRSRQHIAIDVITRILPRKSRNALRIVLDSLACFISFLLAKASYAFVLEEMAMKTELFIGIPTWVAQIVIPFGFAMISLEYAIGVALDIWRIWQDGDRHEAGKGRA